MRGGGASPSRAWACRAALTGSFAWAQGQAVHLLGVLPPVPCGVLSVEALPYLMALSSLSWARMFIAAGHGRQTVWGG